MPSNRTVTNTIRLFIDGAWRDGAQGRLIDVHDPATGDLVGKVATAEIADLEEAAAAAARSFAHWRDTPAIERSDMLRKAAGIIRERIETIAHALTVEQGKPLDAGRFEASLSAQIVEWFAEEGRRTYGRIVPSRSPKIQQSVRQVPVGPVAAFAPWNVPLTQIARKMGIALAAGCSIVIKPPEEAPTASALMFQCFIDAGIPNGVINLVFGIPAEISNYLVAHPAIRKISFTGSVPVGKQLAALAGQYMKRATMELGGHAPVIVTRSAELDAAARALVDAKFYSAGQICTSPTRFLIDRTVYSDFSARFLKYAGDVVVGNGLEPTTRMGPLNNARRLAAMEALVEDARAKGAEILSGGRRIGNIGFFFEPTVVTNVSTDMALMNEEPFGPIAILLPYDTLGAAIEEANRLPYGLAAYAFSDSANDIAEITAGVETGMLAINHTSLAIPETPFGGVKDSGYGSDGGLEAMHGYLQPELVTVATR